MSAILSPQHQHGQSDPGTLVRVGGWLFRRRTSLPFPLALALFLIPSSGKGSTSLLAGLAMVATGEAIRLWAVHQIGAISRTRSDRLGPLVSTGPFALVRNPLYLGNIALWAGFALSARLPWMVPAIVLVLGFEYHAIVRWEERLLESRRGEEYRAYAARVPRWLPKSQRRDPGERTRQILSASPGASAVAFSWRETFYSERGTLIAIAIGYLLLYLKS
jgi:protein-S-isoprenylcysteine O-methyltransferase Ste14